MCTSAVVLLVDMTAVDLLMNYDQIEDSYRCFVGVYVSFIVEN